MSTHNLTDQALSHTPFFTNDATVMGILAILLGLVFYTANSQAPFWRKFYMFVPSVLLCYFLPSLLNTFGLIDGENSQLYYVASRYLLPACLVLLTISVDLKAIAKLGSKAIILFFTGTLGIVIGGPIALMLVATFFPELLGVDGPNAVWRGMTTVAGSWIGGSANQVAMKEIYGAGDQMFSAMVTVDIIVANLWMAVLLIMAANAKSIDAKTGADTSAIDELKAKVKSFEAEHSRIPSLTDIMLIVAVGLGVTGFAHMFADTIAPYFVENFPESQKFSFHSKFFWMIVFCEYGWCGAVFHQSASARRSRRFKNWLSFFIYINCDHRYEDGCNDDCRSASIFCDWCNLDVNPCFAYVACCQAN